MHRPFNIIKSIDYKHNAAMNSSRMRFLSGVCDILSCKDQQHFAIFCNRARKEQGKGGRRLGASAPDESAARLAWRGKRGGNVMKVSIRPSRVTLMIGSASAAMMLDRKSTRLNSSH